MNSAAGHAATGGNGLVVGDHAAINGQDATVFNRRVGASEVVDDPAARDGGRDIVVQIDCPALFEGRRACVAVLQGHGREFECTRSRRKDIKNALGAAAVDDCVAGAVAVDSQALFDVQVASAAVVLIGRPGQRKGAVDRKGNRVSAGVGVGGTDRLAQAGLSIWPRQGCQGNGGTGGRRIDRIRRGRDCDARCIRNLGWAEDYDDESCRNQHMQPAPYAR